MKPTRVLQFALASIVLCSAGAFSQMLAKPGTLVIKSEPSGAKIMINGAAANQATDATFLVSAATYRISVGGPGSTPHCAETQVAIASGATVIKICGEAGWR